MDKVKVLYVDDEPQNLVSFRAAFRFDFDIKTAATPNEVYQILKDNEIHVILSDYRMPELTGVELFEKLRLEFPLPIRILITAYTDVEAVIDAINRGNVYRYIKKPWIEVDIKTAVEEAYHFYITKNILEEKHQELIEAYKDLDKFVYSVSHDLRSPLMGILSVVNLMKKEHSIDEIKQLADFISKNVEKLDKFIINLLEYYRIKRGEMQISNIVFKDLINDIVEVYKVEAYVNNLHIQVNVDQSEEFMNDEMKIKIVLQNIISNAIKYQKPDNPEKKIKIDVVIRRNIANIKVEDNGVGIEEEYIPKIFDMFFRASSLATGSGIGLYNTQHALDKINGTINVHSVYGQGTLFEIEVPGK
jgi:signal transduction histidine kinase